MKDIIWLDLKKFGWTVFIYSSTPSDIAVRIFVTTVMKHLSVYRNFDNHAKTVEQIFTLTYKYIILVTSSLHVFLDI